MSTNNPKPQIDALATLSVLDVLKIVPQGQKYLFVSEDEEQNTGVVLSRSELEDLVKECLWLSQHPQTPMFYQDNTPVWRNIQNHGVVELYASNPNRPHALLNPRNDCSVSMTQSMWESLASSLKDLPYASAHTPLDEAILIGFINGVPSHKIEKAFEWCEARSSDPWEMDKNQTPQWVHAVQRADELEQATRSLVNKTPAIPVPSKMKP